MPLSQSQSSDLLFKIENVNDESVVSKRLVVHTFTVGDVEDPDLWAAEPLYNWEKSEMGQWVMAHSTEPPIWHRHVDYVTYGHRYSIVARLTDRDRTFFELKYR